MRFTILVIILSGALGSGAFAQNAPPIVQEPQTIPLWQGRAPGALGDAPEDIPTLTIYMPPNTTGPDDSSHRRARRQLPHVVDE